MADISKITLPNGDSYDIKDNGAVRINDGTLTGTTTAESISSDEVVAGSLIVNGDARFVNPINGDLVGNVSGNVTGNVSGSAGTAGAFTSAKSVTLTGDVTGSASSTGGWSIATTVADDSHNHTAATLSGVALSTDVLTKTNTTSYTPSADYNPATKKYVDDAVSSNLMIITISRSSATYISDKTFNEIRSHITNGGTVVCKTNFYNDDNDNNVYHLVHNDSNYLAFAYFTQYLDNNTSQLWYSASQITITNSNVIIVDGVATGSYVAPSSTTPKALGTASVGTEYAFARGDHVHPTDTTRAAVSDVLTKTNTTSYTPTLDYHPATKKYVDDNSGNNILYATITSSNNTYSCNKTFSEIYTFINNGGIVILVENGSGFCYRLRWISEDFAASFDRTVVSDTYTTTAEYIINVNNYIEYNESNTPKIEVTSPSNGQMLIYNSTGGKWKNETISLALSSNTIQLKQGTSVISSITLPVYNGGVS